MSIQQEAMIIDTQLILIKIECVARRNTLVYFLSADERFQRALSLILHSRLLLQKDKKYTKKYKIYTAESSRKL